MCPIAIKYFEFIANLWNLERKKILPCIDLNGIFLFILVLNPAEKKNLDKPLLRRKSDLPADILTQKSLESYQVEIRKGVGFTDKT